MAAGTTGAQHVEDCERNVARLMMNADLLREQLDARAVLKKLVKGGHLSDGKAQELLSKAKDGVNGEDLVRWLVMQLDEARRDKRACTAYTCALNAIRKVQGHLATAIESTAPGEQ